MRRGALVWAGAGLVLAVLLVGLLVMIRSNADASAPTASSAPAPSVAAAPAPQPPLPRSLGKTAPPVGIGPLPAPPSGTTRPGPAPAPELHDLDDEEQAARTMLQYDTADFGRVVETLEDGTEVGRVRGAPVTDGEQERLRAEVTKMAGAYETAHDQALAAGGTQPEFARAVHTAREQFDRNVRELYKLTDEQFFTLFPHRKPRPAQ